MSGNPARLSLLGRDASVDGVHQSLQAVNCTLDRLAGQIILDILTFLIYIGRMHVKIPSDGHLAKPYQVKQVRLLIIKYHLGGTDVRFGMR